MAWDFKSSDGNGMAYWDIENGLLVKLRQTQRMVIEMTMKADPQAKENMPPQAFGPIIMKVNNSVEMTLVEPGQTAE